MNCLYILATVSKQFFDVDSTRRANELPYMCHSRQKPFFSKRFFNETKQKQ